MSSETEPIEIGNVDLELRRGVKHSDSFIESVRLAGEEAGRLRHYYVGTEHLLLGLLGQGNKVLKDLGITLEETFSAVEFIIGYGTREASSGSKIPLTPRAQAVIRNAYNIAILRMAEKEVTDDHLLLGLIRDESGIAAGILDQFGVNSDVVDRKVVEKTNRSGTGDSQNL